MKPLTLIFLILLLSLTACQSAVLLPTAAPSLAPSPTVIPLPTVTPTSTPDPSIRELAGGWTMKLGVDGTVQQFIAPDGITSADAQAKLAELNIVGARWIEKNGKVSAIGADGSEMAIIVADEKNETWEVVSNLRSAFEFGNGVSAILGQKDEMGRVQVTDFNFDNTNLTPETIAFLETTLDPANLDLAGSYYLYDGKIIFEGTILANNSGENPARKGVGVGEVIKAQVIDNKLGGIVLDMDWKTLKKILTNQSKLVDYKNDQTGTRKGTSETGNWNHELIIDYGYKDPGKSAFARSFEVNMENGYSDKYFWVDLLTSSSGGDTGNMRWLRYDGQIMVTHVTGFNENPFAGEQDPSSP